MQEGKEGRKTVSLKMECVWAICLISIRMFVHWKLNEPKKEFRALFCFLLLQTFINKNELIWVHVIYST